MGKGLNAMAEVVVEGATKIYGEGAPGGPTGEQGVLIPASNVKNLMLRAEVVEAVAAGAFHARPVETVDEGIELLAVVPACDERVADGRYPKGSVNGTAQARVQRVGDEQPRLVRATQANGQDRPRRR